MPMFYIKVENKGDSGIFQNSIIMMRIPYTKFP